MIYPVTLNVDDLLFKIAGSSKYDNPPNKSIKTFIRQVEKDNESTPTLGRRGDFFILLVKFGEYDT